MWLESIDIECWSCGYVLKNILLPISRREDCMHCGVSLHTCKGCRHRNYAGCTEPRAESVTDQETANFCDYFVIKTDGVNHKERLEQENARQQLDSLFQDSGIVKTPSDQLGSQEDKNQAAKDLELLEDLFKP